MDRHSPRLCSHCRSEHSHSPEHSPYLRALHIIRSEIYELKIGSVWLLLCLLIGVCPSNASPAANGEPLIYAPLPLENPSLTLARNQGLAELLGQLLEREVQTVLYPSHTELLSALSSAEVDLVELGPLPALLASERLAGLAGIATFREASGEAHYRCVIAAAVDGAPSLQALQARMARSGSTGTSARPGLMLTGPESTCGPTVTLWSLHQAGMDPGDLSPQYRGTHDEVALAVLRDPASVGGLKESVALRFNALGLRILSTSPPVPGFTLFAHPAALSTAEREALSRSLLTLTPDRLQGLDNGGNGFAAYENERQTRLAQQRALSEALLEQLNLPERRETPEP